MPNRRFVVSIPLMCILIHLSISTMITLAEPCFAQVELGPLTQEPTPTSATLNDIEMAGFAHADTGEALAVGEGATVIRRTISGGQPTWQSFDAWAAAFFSAEIFDVATSPVSLGNGPVWALAGRDVVVETDLTTTTVIDDRQGAGTVLTPVLPTFDEIWYGAPNLSGSGAPSFIHRYDRSTALAPGIAELSPIADICQVPGGHARYVTLAGDVTEITDQLQRTLLFDQPDNNPLELTYARFGQGCETLIGGGIVGAMSVATFTFDLGGSPLTTPALDRSGLGQSSSTAAAGGFQWQEIPMDGWAVPVAADSFFDVAYQVYLFAACDDITLSSSFVYGHIHGRLEPLRQETAFRISKSCVTRSITYESPSFFPFHPAPDEAGPNQAQGGVGSGGGAGDGRLDILTAGEFGIVLRISATLPLFFGNFETGDFSEWTSAPN